MNAIHKIIAINNKELEQNVPDSASWHADFADTPYIYVGNLHESLTVNDILAIFSQYGNPTHINLVKDRESGKSRGFCYLKYEDQRSCVLAVDNFNGVLIYGKPLKVDHTYYKLMKGQTEDDFRIEYPKAEKKKQIDMPKKLLTDNAHRQRAGDSRYGVSPHNTAIGELPPDEADQDQSSLDNNTGSTEKSPADPRVRFNDNDFADPMVSFKDDDFGDPMAGMLKEKSPESESNHRRDDVHKGRHKRRPHKYEQSEHREKKPKENPKDSDGDRH